MPGGQGHHQNQHSSPNNNIQHHQGLLYPEPNAVDQEGGLHYMEDDLLANGMDFHPGDTNQLGMPPVESPGGYINHQAVSSTMPYNNGSSSAYPVVTHSYAQRFVGAVPTFTERIEATFEGYPLGSVPIRMPDDCDDAELARRLQALQQNQEYHRRHPPVIPDHTLGDMDEKKVFPDFLKFPPNATNAERTAIERENNRIAAKQQKDDRARNNEAAKRSRLAKAEALLNSTHLNVDQSIQIEFLEAQLILLGGDPLEFRKLTPDKLAKIRTTITDRMEDVYNARKKEKSEADSRRRPQRNKRRQVLKAEVNERFARQRAEAARTGRVAPISEGVIASSVEGGMSNQLSLVSLAGPAPSFDFSQD